jgi:hypothetical protein
VITEQEEREGGFFGIGVAKKKLISSRNKIAFRDFSHKQLVLVQTSVSTEVLSF